MKVEMLSTQKGAMLLSFSDFRFFCRFTGPIREPSPMTMKFQLGGQYQNDFILYEHRFFIDVFDLNGGVATVLKDFY